MTKKIQKSYFEVAEGKKIPIKVYHEHRRNVRASIGKKAAILRMPWMLPPDEQRKQLEWFGKWLQKQFKNNDDLQDRYFGKGYQDGDTLKVGEREYLIAIKTTKRKSHNAKLRNGVIQLQLSELDSGSGLQNAIKHLLSRVVGQDFKESMTRRVLELNNLYFKKDITSVNFKYNTSNWGSCSSKGNLNLSTRLLFAPDDVIDYVIIHELAHLIELNHSDRFWKLVYDAMPDYKDKEKWLKDNGNKCNF